MGKECLLKMNNPPRQLVTKRVDPDTDTRNIWNNIYAVPSLPFPVALARRPAKSPETPTLSLEPFFFKFFIGSMMSKIILRFSFPAIQNTVNFPDDAGGPTRRPQVRLDADQSALCAETLSHQACRSSYRNPKTAKIILRLPNY